MSRRPRRRCSPGIGPRMRGPWSRTWPPRTTARRERLERDAAELRTWLAGTSRPTGAASSGGVRQEQPDRQREREAGHGQGCDPGVHGGRRGRSCKHQIIVEAQAHGTGAEQELLVPVVSALQPVLAPDDGADRRRRLPQRSEPAAPGQAAHRRAHRRQRRCGSRDARFATQDAAPDRRRDPLYDKTLTRVMTGNRSVFQPSGLHLRRHGAHVRVPRRSRRSGTARAATLSPAATSPTTSAGAPKGVCGPVSRSGQQCLRTPDRTPIAPGRLLPG